MSLFDSLKKLIVSSELRSDDTNKSNISTLPPGKFSDNLNYMIFEGEGVYSKTGRKRKIKIEAFSEHEAIDELKSSGYVPETINIYRVPFAPPTEEQIKAMKKHKNRIPKNACMEDISFLIEKSMREQRDPDKQLIDFATSQKVKFSYYTGEESLYDRIWYKFSLEEKFAFYVICVKKDKTNIWDFNSFNRYKDMASNYLNDDTFMNSFKRYANKGGEFHGFIREKVDKDGYSINTTSRNTNCYKIAASIV